MRKESQASAEEAVGVSMEIQEEAEERESTGERPKVGERSVRSVKVVRIKGEEGR